MAFHHLHQTQGIILSSVSSGETSKRYKILTRDLGLVFARAQGVREMKSKLRHHLQDFSHVRISLVRGKGGWRITSAEKISNLYADYPEAARVFAKVFSLLGVLVAGEEANPTLFEIVENAAAYAREHEMNERDLRALEHLTVLRILRNLGYIGDYKLTTPLVSDAGVTSDLLENVREHERRVVGIINTALRETQM